MNLIKNRSLLFLGVTLIIVVIAFFVIYIPKTKINKTIQNNSTQTTSVQNTPNTRKSTPLVKVSENSYFYPIRNFTENITFRWFGKLVTSSEIAKPCGAKFSGYHTGVDIEVSKSDIQKPVPVYAISNAKIAQIGFVSGYGGIVVLSADIKGKPYTIYYGHINLSSSTVKEDQNVTASQKLADLGAQCSAQTDGERKHLHFAIHKGNVINIRGYVSTKVQLSNWIDPVSYLLSLKAKAVK